MEKTISRGIFPFCGVPTRHVWLCRTMWLVRELSIVVAERLSGVVTSLPKTTSIIAQVLSSDMPSWIHQPVLKTTLPTQHSYSLPLVPLCHSRCSSLFLFPCLPALAWPFLSLMGANKHSSHLIVNLPILGSIEITTITR